MIRYPLPDARGESPSLQWLECQLHVICFQLGLLCKQTRLNQKAQSLCNTLPLFFHWDDTDTTRALKHVSFKNLDQLIVQVPLLACVKHQRHMGASNRATMSCRSLVWNWPMFLPHSKTLEYPSEVKRNVLSFWCCHNV